jgi:penicillin-binding protein activator
MTRFFSQVVAASLISSLFLTACSTKVTRVTHDSAIDLSGKWNDTDSRLVAEEMVRDALKAGWYSKYEAGKTNPTVVVGEVKNKSHEHIATEAFIKDIERALLNSGKVDFVANKAERQELRDEKADQAANATVESRQVAGEESGAQLMLSGTLNSIVDKEGDKSVVFYQVDLTLMELGSNKKVWIGDKKIKKYVERSSTSL